MGRSIILLEDNSSIPILKPSYKREDILDIVVGVDASVVLFPNEEWSFPSAGKRTLEHPTFRLPLFQRILAQVVGPVHQHPFLPHRVVNGLRFVGEKHHLLILRARP